MYVNDDCQAYVKLLRSEHRHFNTMAQQVSEEIEHLGDLDCPIESVALSLAEKLKHFRTELQHHFAEEEQGSCLDEAVARCPAIGPEVDALEAEHPHLVEKLHTLISLAYTIGQHRDAVSEFRTRWNEFTMSFYNYELAEARLLQRGLGGDATRW